VFLALDLISTVERRPLDVGPNMDFGSSDIVKSLEVYEVMLRIPSH